MKKIELENKIKKLEEQLKIVGERSNMLLMFNAHVTRLCLQHTGSFRHIKTPKDRDIADMYLIFNTHSFVSYFGAEFFASYQPKLIENKEFLDGWNKHVTKNLNPLYDKEILKINEKYDSKIKSPSYVS